VDAAVTYVLAQGVDGLVLVAPHVRTRDALMARALGVPVVIMHGEPGDRQSEGESLALEHLVSLGHRRIARLGGPTDWIEEAARRVGFESALAAHGIPAGLSWTGDWSAEAGAALANEIAASVRSPHGPTAIVVANDQMALGLMTGLRGLGVDVPRDVSVVGFDDNPDAAFYDPPLTTVRLDVAGEARRCVAAVFEGDATYRPGPAVLVVRSSTAVPS
jgi:DNA-binding LacI/PurR family transcriptional regulator